MRYASREQEGRYHVTAHGNKRKAIYRNDSDRAHFLELLSEATHRFGIRIQAYVLMDNHFHLLLERLLIFVRQDLNH